MTLKQQLDKARREIEKANALSRAQATIDAACSVENMLNRVRKNMKIVEADFWENSPINRPKVFSGFFKPLMPHEYETPNAQDQ